MFLGYAPGAVYLPIDIPQKYKRRLESHCTSKKKVWAAGISEPFTCDAIEVVKHEIPVHGYIKLSLSAPGADKHQSLLFSLKPFPKTSWNARKATANELAQLDAFVRTGDKKNHAALPAIKGQLVSVLSSSTPDWKMSVLPSTYQHVDGSIDPYTILIIERAHGSERQVTGAMGSIIRFVDLDNDGFPEVHSSQDCDGICEVVSALWPVPKRLIEIMVH